MKTPEILLDLNTCINAVETTLVTTIHLINGDKIVTKSDVSENDINYENASGDFYCTGI